MGSTCIPEIKKKKLKNLKKLKKKKKKKLFTSQLNILWRSKWEQDWGEAIPSLQSMFKQLTIV